MGKKQPRLCQLTTPFEAHSADAWEKVYPRPQFRRASWQSLCGRWRLAALRGTERGELGEIRVPFPPESRISGICRQLAAGERYRYERTFRLAEPIRGRRVLLHFGAVDQVARVFLNGKAVGAHTGGYLPFTLDVTAAVTEGENVLAVEAEDPLDTELPYGKQRRRRGGMWYTPISGIWQPVWLERVPEDYVRALRLTPGRDQVTVETEGGGAEKCLTLRLPEGERQYRYTGDTAVIRLEDPVLWTPEHPHLYDFTLRAGEDVIESYFALRTVTIEARGGGSYICLNGEPLFLHGLLDQGYYSDGIYLPGSPEGYRWDILTMKRLGFNLLRKHIKIEPDIFYYYCDVYGMLVWQDMVNAGPYSFLLDTALPTLGIKRGVAHRPSPRRREHFEASARATVALLYNHPCVCGYTIFNEGWGQYEGGRLYRELKALDPGRIWDTASGWFTEEASDVTSEHVYFRALRLQARPDKPLVLSEFGGYSCKIPGHAFNLDNNYGYRSFPDLPSFRAGLERLYREEVMAAIDAGLCAAVLTQVSDVEDETNGLVTYDRQVVKVEESPMAALAADLHSAFARRLEEERRGPSDG